MFKDETRYRVQESIRQRDLQAFGGILTDEVLRKTAQRTNLKVTRCGLCATNMIWLGIAAALHQSLSFAEVLTATLRILDLVANGLPVPLVKARRAANRRKSQSRKTSKHRKTSRTRSKHDPRGKDPATLTEEAFAKARRKMPEIWWRMLILVLVEIFEANHQTLVRWKGFRVLALDGTTLTLPQRKPRLIAHFGTSGNGKTRTTQARMVMLQLPFVRLPWRYELCPITEGEPTIAARLLADLQAGDLVLMDRGFVSYGLFCQIQAAGAFFGVRKTASMKLGRAIKRLGPGDRLFRWNKPTGPRWRKQDVPDSLALRVIDYQIKGFRSSAVVTNVLDPEKLSREDWTRVVTDSEAGRPLDRRFRMRQGLYHRRWEIETSFHELKVTQGMERSLRGKTPESIRYEIAGHVVLYLLTRWLMVEAAARSAPDGDPLGLSFKHAHEGLTASWPVLIAAEPTRVPRIVDKLMAQIAAHQVPWRPGRHEPRPGDTQTKNLGNGKYKQPHKLEPKPTQS